MTPQPTTCSGCQLHPISRGFLQPEGSGSRKVWLMGEGAGDNEVFDSLPFRPQAQAGSVLQKVIEMAGFNRSEFLIQNLTNCQPLRPKNKLEGTYYEGPAIETCRQYVDPIAEKFIASGGKVIMSLGNLPTKYMTGMTGSRERQIGYMRGYIFRCERYPELLVVPSYHPSFLRIGAMELLPVLLSDLKKAAGVASGQLVAGRNYIADPNPQTNQLDYWLNPTPAEALAFALAVEANPTQLVAYDIETYISQYESEDELSGSSAPSGAVSGAITQIQFSVRPGSAFVMPWTQPFIDIAIRILATKNPKAGHNVYRFDNIVLAAGGIKVNGQVDDTMLLWRCYQPDLPAHLQHVASHYGMPFAWKHLSATHMDFYGACDVDAVQRIMQKLPDDLRREGIDNSYYGLTRPFWPILEQITVRGMPIDKPSLDKFGEEVDVEKEKVFGEIQLMVPEEVKGKHPKVGYKVVPKEVKQAIASINLTHHLFSFGTNVAQPILDDIVGPLGFVVRPFHIPLSGATKSELDTCVELGLVNDTKSGVDVGRVCKINPFLPTSSQQVLNYIKSKNHKVPVAYGSDRETTNETSLQELYERTGDEGYEKFIEYRKLLKMRSQYCGNPENGTRGFQPDEDGRVRAFFTFKSTMQLATTGGPPLLTRIKHSELAKKFMECIRAKAGHVLLEFDMTGFHSLMTGLEAGDSGYMRLSQLGIHDFFTARIKKIPGSEYWLELQDDDLREKLVWVKQEHRWFRDFVAKKVTHGSQFGLGKRKLFYMWRKYIQSEAEAGKLLGAFQSIFPRIGLWQQQTRALAHRQHFLSTRWGCKRRFWDVGRFNHKYGRLDPGQDYNEVLSYQPSNDAHGMFRVKIMQMEKLGMLERYRLILPFHDAVLFECPLTLEQEALEAIHKVMGGKCETLGISCGVEASRGEDWGHMETVTI